MRKLTLGLFDRYEDAEKAIFELEESGFTNDGISVVMKDRKEAKNLAKNTGVKTTKGAASGAVTGGVIGGIAGLLVGIGAVAIPGIGGLMVAGPIASALGLTGAAGSTVTGAASGVLAGGLIGALTGLGASESEAKTYESGVKNGNILIGVSEDKQNQRLAEDVFRENFAHHIKTVDSNKKL
jgi:hypothetical protein